MKRVSTVWKVIAIVLAVAAAGAAVYLWLRAKKNRCICGDEDCLCEVECCCDDDCCDAPLDEPIIE